MPLSCVFVTRKRGLGPEYTLHTDPVRDQRIPRSTPTRFNLWSNLLTFNGQRIVGLCKLLMVNAVKF
jgi:hypothetical protein